MWWGNLNQMLPPFSWRQQACWDGFMKRLWFGPCKMQTRRVVQQTLKSKWGMEKHFNSSCLSVFFFEGSFGCLYHYPGCAANLQPKATNLSDSFWFWLRKRCCWTLVPWHLHILQRCWLTCPGFHSLASWNMPFSRPSYDPWAPTWTALTRQQRIVPWAQCSKSGQPWKVVAIEILLNRSCHFFFSGTSAWSEGNRCWIWWYDFIYFHSGIRVTAKSYYTFQPCTVRLSFTWGAGGQVAERAWMQNDWILGITKKINDKHIDLNQHPENSVWAWQKRFWHFSRRYLKWPWQICQDMSTEATWDSEEDCMTCCDRDSLVGWGLLTPRTFHGIVRFQKCQ